MNMRVISFTLVFTMIWLLISESLSQVMNGQKWSSPDNKGWIDRCMDVLRKFGCAPQSAELRIKTPDLERN